MRKDAVSFPRPQVANLDLAAAPILDIDRDIERRLAASGRDLGDV